MPPSRTSPCSPSPPTPTSEKLTSARSSDSANLLEDSYGRRNREAIAAREMRVAARLRAVEQAYQTADERDIMIRPPEPATTRRPAEYADGGGIELGLER